MHLRHHIRGPLIIRRNLNLHHLVKAWRIQHPGAFSRVGKPTWMCVSPKKWVEWHWEFEIQNGRVTKNRTRRWVDGVEEDKRECLSGVKAGIKSGDHDRKVADSEREIDFITMKRRVQPRDRGPAVIVDERGFEKMALKVGNQLEDASEIAPKVGSHPGDACGMPPSQSLVIGRATEDRATFQMPPPQDEPADTVIAMPPPGTESTAVPGTPVNPDVIARQEPVPKPMTEPMSEPMQRPVPELKGTNTSGLNAAPQMPPPPPGPVQPITHRKALNPDIGVPEPRATKTGLFVPPPKVASSEAAAWTWEPVNDPTGTKAVDEAWRSTDSVTASAPATRVAPTPSLHRSTLPTEDADLDALLPHHIRASMSRHTPSTYPPVSASAESDAWTETFGIPSEPVSYTTVTLEPFTLTASTHMPLSLLRAHTSSFLSLAPPSASPKATFTSDPEQEAEWLGFDPTPATSAESVFVFLLYPESSRPSFALATLSASIPAPTQELRPTEALALLQHSGMFLPYLRAAREAGGSLVHTSSQGATWAVTDQGMGWRVVNKLEAVGRTELWPTPPIQEVLAVKSEGAKGGGSSGKEETAAAKGRGRSLVKRMFWTGVWVGGLTGMMGFFGQA